MCQLIDAKWPVALGALVGSAVKRGGAFLWGASLGSASAPWESGGGCWTRLAVLGSLELGRCVGELDKYTNKRAAVLD